VQRIFVNAAIKKRCAAKPRRSQLALQGAADVRPRLSFPHPHQCRRAAAATAKASPIRRKAKLQRRRPRLLVQGFSAPSKTAGHAAKTKPPMTMASLPAACKAVLAAPDAKQSRSSGGLSSRPLNALGSVAVPVRPAAKPGTTVPNFHCNPRSTRFARAREAL